MNEKVYTILNNEMMLHDIQSIMELVDSIICYAYLRNASDIHIEPEEKHSLIRFRLDGVLHDIAKLPKNMHERIIARVKILSKLKTDEHLSPQDGKMRLQLAAALLALHPTAHVRMWTWPATRLCSNRIAATSASRCLCSCCMFVCFYLCSVCCLCYMSLYVCAWACLFVCLFVC